MQKYILPIFFYKTVTKKIIIIGKQKIISSK